MDDLKASARGPPIEATWFEAHPAAQFNWSPLPVDSFNDTSDEEFPGIEMERQVAELIGLSAGLSGCCKDLGLSSKNCLNI